MSPSSLSISEPIPISLIAGRYLLFDINVVTYLRRTYHICGVLIGSIPQVPQQNVFLGLPVELLPEEAKLLIEKEVAYVVDDTTWHSQSFLEQDRRRYLDSIRSQGVAAKRAAEDASRKKTEMALAKQAMTKARKEAASSSLAAQQAAGVPELVLRDASLVKNDDPPETSLFIEERSSSRTSSSPTAIANGYAITPTVSYNPVSLPQNLSPQTDPVVPSSYPLFAHLHSKDYFIMPGLRFGCDYNVYPGDPLRFHSHFLAVGYEWEQDIPLLDLIGGGRLGTAVKKGFLIGGEDSNAKHEDAGNVRAFCIEWGGM